MRLAKTAFELIRIIGKYYTKLI